MPWPSINGSISLSPSDKVCSRAQNNDWACPEELLLRAELTAQTGSELAGLTCRRTGAAPGAPATLAVTDVAALVRVDPSAPGGLGSEDPPVAAESVPENGPGGILEGGQTLYQALALPLDQNLASPRSPALGPGAPLASRPPSAQHPTLEHPHSPGPAPSLAHAPVTPSPHPVAPLARALSERDPEYPEPRPRKAGHAGHWLRRAGAAGESDKPVLAAEGLRSGHADPAARALLPDGHLDDEWGDYDIDPEPYSGGASAHPYDLEPYPEDKSPDLLDVRGHKALDEARAQAEQALARAAASDDFGPGGKAGGGAFGTHSSAGNPGGRNRDLDWVEGATALHRQGSADPDLDPTPDPVRTGHAGVGLHLPGGLPEARQPNEQHASGREQPEHAGASPDPAAPPPVSHSGWGIHLARDEDVKPDPKSRPDPKVPPPISHAGWAIHLARDEDVKPDPEPSPNPEKQQAGHGEVDAVPEPGQGGAPILAPLPPTGAGIHLTKELPAGAPVVTLLAVFQTMQSSEIALPHGWPSRCSFLCTACFDVHVFNQELCDLGAIVPMTWCDGWF